MRPKSSGVSSNSADDFSPSSSTSAAHTVTCPVLRSSSTRACGWAPGRLVVRRQQRLLDRLDEHVEGDLLLPLEHPQDAHVDVHQASSSASWLPVELDLHRAPWRRRRSPACARVPVDVEHHAVVVALADPAGQRLALGRGHLDQPAEVAAPVPRQGQRPVDAGRGDLERVRRLAHRRRPRRARGHLPGGLGDVVEGDAAVRSTATRSTRRLPAGVSSTASRSKPRAPRGSATAAVMRSRVAPSCLGSGPGLTGADLLCCCRPPTIAAGIGRGTRR